MMIVSRVAQRLDRLGRGRRLAAVLDVLDRALGAVADHELLEGALAAGGRDPRAQRVVGRDEHARRHAERAPQVVDRLRQPRAVGEPHRAVQADRQVAVAEVEPDVLAERAQLVHRRERVAGEAPAALVDRVGEPERDEIRVGADVRAVDLQVVAGVGDDGEFGAELVQQAASELRASGAPREQDDVCHSGGQATKVRRRMRLAPLTTLRLGGPAERLIEAHSEEELVAAVRAGADLVLAGGSNVVIADDGVPGTVRAGAHARASRARATCSWSQAGEPWDEVVAHCVAAGLQGFECLSGIPGSTGATPIQNVGAYGQDVSETVAWVRVYDRETDASRCWTPRRAASTTAAASSSTATAGPCWRSRSGCRESALSGPLRYAELARALDVPVGGRAPLADVRAAVLALRRGKGMVIDPADPDSVSAGSFFTNPILDADGVGDAPGRARVPGAGRPDQDLGGVADRAARGSPAGTGADERGSRPSTRSRWSTAARPRRPS